MALDPAHNLYVTGYTSNSVNRFNTSGVASGTFGSGYNSHPEDIAFDTNGFAYVGQEGGNRDILKLNSAGSVVASYNAATQVKGTDRLDVASDQCTILYTSQGKAVKRFNACTNTQLSDFAVGLPGTEAFDVNILLTGGALVADTQSIVRLDGSGSVVQTYDPDGAQNNCWTALSLGETTNEFWAGDRCSGNVYKLDLGGAVLDSFNTGRKTSVQGLAVNRGLTAATATDLSVTMTDAPDPVSSSRPNESPPEITTVLYTANVANAGPGQARSVTYNSTISGGGTVDFAVGQGWTCSNTATTATCTRDTNLGIGAAAPPLFTVVIVPETNVDITLTNTATVSGNEADPDPTDDSATETTTVDDSPAPDRFFTFCRGSTGCAGHTVRGLEDDITDSRFSAPPNPGQLGGVVSFEEVAQTFACGSADDSQEVLFFIPDGYENPSNPVEITVNVDLPGSGISGPNAPYCILKPGGTPQQVPPCLMPGVAAPSPCETRRSFSGGTLSMTFLVLSGDPRGHN
jgi:hypothetical protein